MAPTIPESDNVESQIDENLKEDCKCERCEGKGCEACSAAVEDKDPLDEVFIESHEKDPKKVKMGKRNKAGGSAFEKKVREDLEKKGWIVSKFQSTVEFAKKKEVFEISQISSLDARLIHAKNKFLGPGKPVMLGAGFPDFIAFRRQNLGGGVYDFCYDVIGVEAKSNGKLSRLEKNKCKFLLEKRIFNRILVASKKKEGRKVVVEYVELKMQELV